MRGERFMRWAPAALVLLAIAAVYASGLNRYVSLTTLQQRHEVLKGYVAQHFWLALFLYTAIYAATTATAIPGAVFVTLTGGFLFGAWVGGAATSVAATIGAVVIYYVARTSVGSWLREWAEHRGGAVRRMREGLDRNAFWYLLSLRLAPVVPFVLVNIVSGLAAVPVRAYVIATLVGVFPATVIYSSIGAGLDRLFARGENPDMHVLADPHVYLPMIGLAVLSLLPVAFRLLRWRRSEPVREG